MHSPIRECIRHHQGETLKTKWNLFAIWTAAVIAASAILTAIIDTSTAPILGVVHDLHPYAIFFALMLVGMVIVGSTFWISSRSRTVQLR
ncbi:MAG: hypothetical protein ABIR91_03050 [Candidatus Saccharimonadales bacterium]